jgi:hypothetical protein
MCVERFVLALSAQGCSSARDADYKYGKIYERVKQMRASIPPASEKVKYWCKKARQREPLACSILQLLTSGRLLPHQS